MGGRKLSLNPEEDLNQGSANENKERQMGLTTTGNLRTVWGVF